MTREKKIPLYTFLTPSNLHIWLLFLILRINNFFAHNTQIKNGKFLGRILHKFIPKRRAITRRNISLAFPDKNKSQVNHLALKHFEEVGASVAELGITRWGSSQKIYETSTWEGKQFIEEAKKNNRGILLLSAHFTTLEIGGSLLRYEFPEFDVVYRKNRNEFVTEILRSTREGFARKAIEKRDIKTTIRTLKNGGVVWYAPDQSYNRKQSAVIPFFNKPAMTNTATSVIAKLGNAVVLPFFPRRKENGHYIMTFKQPLKNFPSDDSVSDTEQYVKILEKEIRLCPEQYYWIHKKYKNLPVGFKDFYSNLDEWK